MVVRADDAGAVREGHHVSAAAHTSGNSKNRGGCGREFEIQCGASYVVGLWMWFIYIPLPPPVQATVNDQKLTEPTPSVAWTRVLLTRYTVTWCMRKNMVYYSENQRTTYATNAIMPQAASLYYSMPYFAVACILFKIEPEGCMHHGTKRELYGAQCAKCSRHRSINQKTITELSGIYAIIKNTKHTPQQTRVMCIISVALYIAPTTKLLHCMRTVHRRLHGLGMV